MKSLFLILAAFFVFSASAYAETQVLCGSSGAGNIEGAQSDLNKQLKDLTARIQAVSAPTVATVNDGSFRTVIICVTVTLK